MQTRGREPRRIDSGARQWARIMMLPSRWFPTSAQLRRACPRRSAPPNAALLSGSQCVRGARTTHCSSHRDRQPPNAEAQLQAIGPICDSPARMH